MAELVDAADSKSVFARSGSSSLPRGTILRKTLIIKVFFFACRKDRSLRQLLQKLRAPSPVAVDEHREATSGCEAVVNPHTTFFAPSASCSRCRGTKAASGSPRSKDREASSLLQMARAPRLPFSTGRVTLAPSLPIQRPDVAVRAYTGAQAPPFR